MQTQSLTIDRISMLQFTTRLILLTLVVASQHLQLPTLEAIASGRLAPPKGKEGTAIGIFPHLASDLREGNTIYYTISSSQNGEGHSNHLPSSDRVQISAVDVADLRTKVEQLRTLVQATDNANAHAELAQTLQILEMRSLSGGSLAREALMHYTRAIELGFRDSDPSLLLNLGLLHNWLGDTTSAASRFTQLLATPGLPAARRAEALNHRADVYGQNGDFERAARDHQTAIDTVPADSTAWAALCQILKDHPNVQKEGAANWTTLAAGMENALAQNSSSNQGVQGAKLRFALFTAHDMRRREFAKERQVKSEAVQSDATEASDARGDLTRGALAPEPTVNEAEAASQAWQHLKAANDLEFSRQTNERSFYESKQGQSARLEQTLKAFKHGAWPAGVGAAGQRAPVFVVGMMRSGSSLLEQVLASHSQVVGCGENSVFGAHAESIIGHVSAAIRAGSMENLVVGVQQSAVGVLSEMAKSCIPAHRQVGGPHGVTRMVDKQLFNFRHLGLIHLVFPDAPIVETTRNFMDVVLSIYRHNFGDSNGLGFSFNLREIVQFYVECRRAMDHWKTELPPGRVHTVRHEDLIVDLEGSSRALLNHLGLPFEPSVLDFHATTRHVSTMSAAQVRSPLSLKGVGAWRPYERFLVADMDALELQLGLSEILGHTWREDPPQVKEVLRSPSRHDGIPKAKKQMT